MMKKNKEDEKNGMYEKSDNELIAEFMGWQKVYVGYFGGEDETDWQRNKQHQKWMKDVELEMVGDYIVNVAEDKWEFWDDVAYDTSWDWLMPAFDKFASLDLDSDDYSTHCVAISEKILECDIQGSCERLAEAIRWYNSQQHERK